MNSSEGPAPLVHVASRLFKQADPDVPPGIAFYEPQLSVETEPTTPTSLDARGRSYALEEDFILEDPSSAYHPLTTSYEESEDGEGSPLGDVFLEDDWDGSSPVSEFSDEWEEEIEWQVEEEEEDDDGGEWYQGSGTITPTTPAIISKLDDLASNIRSLSVWDADENESSVEVAREEEDEIFTAEKRQFYSEFEIVTNPSVFKYKYLIIPEAALNGVHHLSRASHGFFNLKPYTSLLDTLHVSDPESWKLWLKLQDYSIDSEDWADPILEHPSFFNQYATLIFVERPGMFSKGGDPIYEFIGNFYVRRHDPVLAKGNRPRPGSFERVLADSPYLSASLVILQFVEDPFIQ
ncbi:hypothetical protein H1R20_g12491, partial [Candolleomyces eurysporus]